MLNTIRPEFLLGLEDYNAYARNKAEDDYHCRFKYMKMNYH